MSVSIYKAEGTWVVRAGGAVLGETTNALELTEPGHNPVIYFPRESIAMALLEPTDHRTTCPHKGEARYFTIVLKSYAIENGAWSYEAPMEAVSAIKDYIAFMPRDEIKVERV